MAGTISILFFAGARQAMGASRVERPVDANGTTLDQLLAELVTEKPRLAAILRVSRFVRNGEYLKNRDVTVRAGDEIGIHPPYSGG